MYGILKVQTQMIRHCKYKFIAKPDKGRKFRGKKLSRFSRFWPFFAPVSAK